ncbi:peptidylprolyl isomerase [bacterium]|nr:peptidylprolyl isomerase [bacterium]
MIIEKDKVVSINYVLCNEEGLELDSTQFQDPLVYLHGASNILPKLEEELEGKGVKARVRVKISPKDGYGEYIDELVQSFPLSKLPNADKVKVGVQFQLNTPQGPTMATITKVEDGNFTVDMNHPLAGQTLNFDIEVVDIREATTEEKDTGHIHGEGCGCGHSH